MTRPRTAPIGAISAILLISAGLALSACSSIVDPGMFRTPMATKEGVVNSAEAASLISAYRRANGKSGVSVDATLTNIAAVHSRRMAAANKMAHVLPGEGSFRQRLNAGGYSAGIAAENVAAGQKTLADVLAAWKRSPGHNRNLLMNGVTQIGIAVSVAPESWYKTFWTLVLATPRAERIVVIPGGGGLVVPSATGAMVEIN